MPINANTLQKLKTKNNFFQSVKTTLGASSTCLRTSAFSMVYLTAEYSSAVWLKSSDINKIYTQLNTTMIIVSGTLKSKLVDWPQTLCNIAPPLYKIQLNPTTPIRLHANIQEEVPKCLRSRKHAIGTYKRLWRDSRSLGNQNSNFQGLTSNRRCTSSDSSTILYTNGALRTVCQCGDPTQTTDHILYSCPLLGFEGIFNDIKSHSSQSLTLPDVWFRNIFLVSLPRKPCIWVSDRINNPKI